MVDPRWRMFGVPFLKINDITAAVVLANFVIISYTLLFKYFLIYG